MVFVYRAGRRYNLQAWGGIRSWEHGDHRHSNHNEDSTEPVDSTFNGWEVGSPETSLFLDLLFNFY